ncbi:molybdate ABC transporter substrate-binding protein [uncultured Roseobacter sp.]|uniref:molybdate ABC transporter substrate-binding protein n=1 Tax=uncultured Roseobacter sp. TaxID=114847 RepID=UPI002618FE8C|nr:molybdate ABC transporter substrate-binding protein [uncultured Roseobacter sp.]
MSRLRPSARSVPRRTTALALVATLCLAFVTTTASRAETLTVFAAASLKNALDEIAAGFTDQTGTTVTLSYAGSSVLARQVAQGAPADVIITASADWMDWLAEQGAIDPTSRGDLTSNRMALIAHGAGQPPADFDAASLRARLAHDRIAMALVEAVPAGIYGKAALAHLGLWDALAPQVVQTDNVRASLALVAAGEAPFGIVYASDAQAEPRVSLLGLFPEDSHPPIRYPAALTKRSRSDMAMAFLMELRSTTAQRVLRENGFIRPETRP